MRRGIWLTAVGLAIVGLAVGGGVALSGGHDGLKPKRGVAPSMALPSGVGGTSVTQRAGATADATISWFTGPIARSMDRDLRDLPSVPANPLPALPEFEPPATVDKQPTSSGPAQNVPSGVRAPSAGVAFAGLSHDLVVTGGQAGAGWPPDTNGDVGKNFYVETVNTAAAFYNKAGVQQAAFTLNSLWSGAGTGTPCDTIHNGDPVALYDSLADRFFITDFSWSNLQDGPYYECVAVAKTSNPLTGGWWFYAILASDAGHPWLSDYPKMGIWPDGLYISYNMFDCTNATCSTSTYMEPRVQALPRTVLEAGGVPTILNADVGSTAYFTLVPSNMRGPTGSPPAGRENLLVSESGTLFAWEVWKFHADFVTPGLSTLTGPTTVSQTSYSVAPTTVPTSANSLDTLRERVMMQNQYTNFSGTESLWVNHTVRAGASTTPAGIQWAQINVNGGTINTTPVQQQLFGDTSGTTSNGTNRWMGSLAVDKSGNMALGYSAVTNATPTFGNPSIRYTGRLAGDALGTLQGEATMITGGGSQGAGSCSGGTCIRWGDYSAMTLDPDGCTFWYTNEYYATTGGNWQTRIGSMTYAPNSCTPIGGTAVSIARLLATRTKQGVSVTWRTGTETAIAGFDVLRGNAAGRWTKLNRLLIPARYAGQARGAAYRFLDRTAVRGAAYNYRVRVVATTGTRTSYGLAAVSG
jgi:hypothetical protein